MTRRRKKIRTMAGRYLVVLDFEATCQERGRPQPQEIIEFPSVVLDTEALAVVDRIQLYVRPLVLPELSRFCTELTGIEQATVDAADDFPAAFKRYEEWVARWPGATFVTCGDWDLRTCLPRQAEVVGLKVPERYRRWINIKHAFERLYRTKARGLAGMLATLGMQFEGRPHSGLDDCVNTARVMARMIRDGYCPGAPTAHARPT